jgi:hypothetical protein
LRLWGRGFRAPIEHARSHLPHIFGTEQIGGLQGGVEFLGGHTRYSLKALKLKLEWILARVCGKKLNAPAAFAWAVGKGRSCR